MIKAQVFLVNTPSEQYNLYTGYLNFSTSIYRKKRGPIQDYLKTISILEEGIERFPKNKKLKKNYTVGVNVVLEKMMQAQAIEGDIDLFLDSTQTFLDPKDYQVLKKMRYMRTSIHYLKTNQNLVAAKKNIKNLWEYDKKDNNIKYLIQEFSYNLVQNNIKNPKNLTEDLTLIDSISEFPKDLTQEPLGNYYSGLAENNFNAKKFNDAIQIMQKGREKIGNTRLIKENGFIFSVNSAQYFIDSKENLRAIEFYKYALDFKNDRNVIHNLGILYAQTIHISLSENNEKLVSDLIAESKKITPNHPSLRDLHKKYS